ncbi:hypothetical protein VTO42DRAFT_7413 [Malbranchea cinnamomea]
MRRSFVSLMGADPSDDYFHTFETSWIFPPLILFCIRALICAFVFASLFTIFGWNGAHGQHFDSRQSFSFFTNLTFWGVAFYFLFASIHTFLYYRTGQSVLFHKWPRALRALHSLYYSTIITFPFVVTIIYWSFLYDGTWFPIVFDAWRNVATHILPAVFALFEIIFTTTTPPPLLHIVFLILILLLYLAVAYITYAAQGFYVYSFLDPGANGENRSRVAGYCFAILGVTIVIFLIDWLIIWLRRRWTSQITKWARARYWTSGGDAEMAMHGWK